MRQRRLVASLVGIVTVAVVGLVATLLAGWSPQLGLDLQGGASVVLLPAGEVRAGTLDTAIDVIRNRVDGLGVAEPEITRNGDAIVVSLPGVKDQDRALEVVGQTAELRFRYVLQELGPVALPVDPSASTVPGATTLVPDATQPPTETPAPGETVAPTQTVPGETVPAGTVTPPASVLSFAGAGSPGGVGEALPLSAPTATTVPAVPTETSLAPAPVETTPPAVGESVPGETVPGETAPSEATMPALPTDSLPTDTLPADTLPTDTVPTVPTTPSAPVLDADGLTPADQDLPDTEVVLAQRDDNGTIINRFLLGPTFLRGDGVSEASADLGDTGIEWSVQVQLTDAGTSAFSAAAAECFNGGPQCPPSSVGGGTNDGGAGGRIAIVLDGVVQSAPRVNEPNFDTGEVNISGDFTEGEAENLALVLRYGSLPVTLEPQAVQTVSASLGSDSLRAGVIAGIVGVGLVLAFMVFYYRWLGLVVLAGLCVSAALLWTVISWLGETRGLALTLAGATGVIVSIGVTVDSYVVYFERLKDEIRAGRTLRGSAERGFKSAYRTIVAADLVSLIGAALLWWLTVGAVRGFALFLGLSALLDMVVAYFFTRPLVILLSRSARLRNREVLGVTSGEALVLAGAGR